MFETLIGVHIFGMVLMVTALFIMFRGDSTYAQKLVIYVLVAEFVHNAGYLLELSAKSLDEAFLALKFEYIGASLVMVFYMMFVRHYCGFREKIVFERFLLLVSLFIVIMVWTSPAHNFYYREISFVEDGLYPHLELVYGPGFYITSLLLVIVPWVAVIYALLHTIIKNPGSYKRSGLRWIILGTNVELLVFIVYILGFFPSGYDPIPVTMAYMLSLMIIFIWNKKDFNLTRAASNTVLNSLGDCMITLDEDYKVLIYNNAAKDMFPEISIYQRIDTVSDFPIDSFDEDKIYEFAINDKHYEGHIRPLEDFEKHVRGYTVLITDVTSTYEYIQKLNVMRKEAEKANRAKTDFLANMSHEIRTPMNAVVGMSELIIEESRGRKMYDYACDIKSAALNLLSIINDILDLSKVEAGKMELVEEKYYIQVLVKDTINLVQRAAEQKGLQMKVDLADNIPYHLFGDEGRIRQILINILNNAIKFTNNGYVSMAISGEYIDEEHINLKIIVEDTGIGIKEEDLGSIFTAFQQLDMNKNRKTEGTGLGLPITKQLVHLMQGDIKVESEYGKGTRFTIQIKQKVVDRKTIREVPMTRKAIEQQNEKMFLCKDYRVLVVDDNVINRKVATAMLTSYGVQIHEASSGMAAIELVKKNEYDMIFMDHMMPEMDGVEATRIIQTECGDSGKNAIIIALTANAIQGAREMYMENGFDDFLSKPFERIQMHELLDKWISKEHREYVDIEVEEEKVSEDEMAEIFMFGVNVREALKRKNSGMQEYLQSLDEFRRNGEIKKPLICKLAQEKDYEKYAIEAHALKNAAATIGADNLSKEAKEHEQAAKEGSYGFVDRQYAQFVVNYERILIEIERILKKKMYGPFAEIKTVRKKPIDEGYMKEQMEQIRALVQENALQDALERLEALLQYAIPDNLEKELIVIRSALEEGDEKRAFEGFQTIM